MQGLCGFASRCVGRPVGHLGCEVSWLAGLDHTSARLNFDEAGGVLDGWMDGWIMVVKYATNLDVMFEQRIHWVWPRQDK